ncbi:fam-l protein [Plasmodium malariae]|uniref:Fam-l protein n=1 Tax=Plasmodium malariae TaxID=5858 RepID=A0A1D3SN78_PLAMA|nr:fam-l protein [Plasmodium malariae]SCO92872.1 fam-l protein [Plasmodium malariae]
MKQKIKLLLFIKIAEFVLLSGICHFKNCVSIFKNSVDDKCIHGKKMDARTYRILAKYKHDKDSNLLCLKEDIRNYEKKLREKNKWSNEISSMSIRGHKQHMKNKSCMFETKKYSHMEKKIFKELDYIDFLQNTKTISDKIFRKTVFKKYRVRIILPLFLFILLSTYLILDFSGGYGLGGRLLSVLNRILGKGWSAHLRSFLKNLNLDFLWPQINMGSSGKTWTLMTKPFLIYVIYLIPFLILGFTTILYIFYYHKKVKKYQKIKFRKR